MRIITGRAGYGKSYYCMNEIKQNLEEGYDGPLIYIVPEQFSLGAEYDVSKVINKGGILEVQVLTFKRLCHRIYNEFGYESKSISAAGKAMLIYSIMRDLEKDLILLKGVDRKAGLITTVCDLISEFKRYNITPEVLLQVNTKNKRLSDKLRELAYIYREYEKRIDGKFIDSDDDLRIVTKYIEQSKIPYNAKIWIDGFDGFTPQELEVIKALNKKADVTIAISESRDENELFLLNRKTIEKLKRFANIEEINLDEAKRFENDEIRHIEKNFNAFPVESYENKTKHVDISVTSNLYQEVENIACDVLRKVRDEGYRYDNILIATRNIEVYKPIFKMIFERYNIPYFIDTKTDLSLQPLVCLVMSLLDVCSKNFMTESVISYLKTGLTNIEDYNDIDLIENYVLKYGIKSTKWLDEWKYDKNEVNDKINQIRQKIIEPIQMFKQKLNGKKTVKEFVVAVYEFLVQINVEKNIQNLLEQIKDSDSIMSTENMFANSYIQVWNIFIKLLDELVDTLGTEKITFDKFQAVLKAGISTQQIGLIPTNKDQLTIGDIARSKNSHIDILYVVGVNDGLFPMQYNDEGFINDNERNLLLENDIEIAKDTKMMLLEENFNIYKILTTSKKELHISYPIADDAGTVLRPSSIINQLKKMFPKITENNMVMSDFSWEDLVNTKNSTFVHLASEVRKGKNEEKVDDRWFTVYKWFENNNPDFISLIKAGLSFKNTVSSMSKTSAQSLYGSTMNSSVSKLETYASCPFMFYLRYGLNAKERKVYKLETPDVGIFMHDILDKFSRHLEKQDISWRSLEKEDIEEITSTIVDETLSEFKYNIFTSNNKLKFLSLKLKRVVKRVLWLITLHIKTSEFDVAGSEITFGENAKYPPIEIELEEGNKLVLNGKIDRIDIAKTEDNKYIRVIDYKSSSKDIKLSNVYYGLQLQLITYLDVVSSKDILPGGALYLKLDDPIITSKKDIPIEQIEDEIRKKLRMNGIILSDVKLVKAMDTNIGTESNNINLSVKKDGTFSKMPVATEDELKKLCKHTKYLLKQFAEEILNGNLKNEPIKNKGKTPCTYCDYKTICNFDKELGNRFKYINELKNEEVFEQMHFGDVP